MSYVVANKRKIVKGGLKMQCDLDITINILQKYKNLYILLLLCLKEMW